MEDLVIIGGGIAGLSCLNALLDADKSPLLLEGTSIGTPKMCGEFLSPQTIKLLRCWNIHSMQIIPHATFFANNKKFSFDFPQPAGAMSRSEAEQLLAQRAVSKAGRIRENAFIKKIIPATQHSPYIFQLATGEEIVAKTAIFATGKYAQAVNTMMAMPYFGIKLHFPHIIKSKTLFMHSYNGAYFGIVPISEQISNFACLVKKDVIEKIGSCQQFFDQLVIVNPHLQEIAASGAITESVWFETRSPDFKLKCIPEWPNSYWIGDAVAGLYPAIGSGFAHAINSAILAAECYLQTNAQDYLRLIKQQIKPRLLIGRLMHQLLLRPKCATLAFSLLQYNPWMLTMGFKKLAYTHD